MIRKAMMCVMAAAMASGFGCSAENRDAAEKVTIRPEKVLIVYYSWSGNTRVAAEQIRKITGGTLFEIKTAKAYPAEYDACVEQAKKECRSGFCPELASKAGDLAKYDVIFLGTPNWWSTMAPPVRTFLTTENLSGKTIIPFVTHGGGGMANCERDMRKISPNTRFAKGGAFSGSGIRSAESAVKAWINQIATLPK